MLAVWALILRDPVAGPSGPMFPAVTHPVGVCSDSAMEESNLQFSRSAGVAPNSEGKECDGVLGWGLGSYPVTFLRTSWSGDSAAVPSPKIALPFPKDLLAQQG